MIVKVGITDGHSKLVVEKKFHLHFVVLYANIYKYKTVNILGD